MSLPLGKSILYKVFCINFRGLKGFGIPIQVYMSERILQNSEVCIRSLAFIRRLRIHGILRANIKYFIGKNTRYRKSKGFTLIELLTVIAIIGILTAIATVSYTNAQRKARDNRRKSDLKTIQQALELYFQQNGYYPPTKTYGWPNWCAPINGSTDGWGTWMDVKNALEGGGFIKTVPKDPIHAGINYAWMSKDYVYNKIYATGKYRLAAHLENTNDPEKGSYIYDVTSDCNAVDATPFEYQVTSP